MAQYDGEGWPTGRSDFTSGEDALRRDFSGMMPGLGRGALGPRRFDDGTISLSGTFADDLPPGIYTKYDRRSTDKLPRGIQEGL